MAPFLSDEWIEDLDHELRDDERAQAAARDIRLTVGQVVTDRSEGDVRYVIRVGDGKVRVDRGDVEAADITFTQDRTTAAAIAQGELGAQAAFMEGRVRVGGDLGLLMSNAPVLAELDDALGRTRARTTF